MAYDIIAARGYGSAEAGDVTNPQTVNHFAAVSAVGANSITVDDATNFPAGTEILMHIAGAQTSSALASNLGSYKFAKVMNVSGNVLTLSTTPISASPSDYFYQAVSVPHYQTLTISETISPPAFLNGVGGLLVFKAQKLVFSGAINLVDKGLTNADHRPLTTQEDGGILDTAQLSAYENEATATNLTLQKGDGACLILAKRIDFTSSARIGDPNFHGIARCRNADDSLNRNSSYTNIGGSSIAIVAETINSFSANIISKYRSKTLEAGKGLARAYIATESQLPFDEGLYSADVIQKPERLADETLISDCGDGSDGIAASRLHNSYAKVSAISGKTFSLTKITSGGVAQFKRGALVMIHASFLNSNNLNHLGRFMIAKVVGVTNDSSGNLKSITLNHSLDELGLANFNTNTYLFQAIAIPQYSSFNVSSSRTPKFDNGRGGIFAIAVNGICDLRGKVINVEGKGGSHFSADYVSNARMKHRLPIGQGHGSVFILAKTLKLNSSSRIGATYSGNSYGGDSDTHEGGGYRGETATNQDERGGSGYRGGQCNGNNGGFFSNASKAGTYNGGLQGASIFIVAENIDGLCLDALSTGGQGGKSAWKNGYINSSVARAGSDGGCGYGGGGATFKEPYNNTYVVNNEAGAGGVHGGGSGDGSLDDSTRANGGGASGFCFVYHN